MIKFELLEVGQTPTGMSPSQNKKSYWYKYCTRRKIILLLFILIVIKIIVIFVAYKIFFSDSHHVISPNKTNPFDRIDTPMFADSSGTPLTSVENGYTFLNHQISNKSRLKISSTSERTGFSGDVPHHLHPSVPYQGADNVPTPEENPISTQGAENHPILLVNLTASSETKHPYITPSKTSNHNASSETINPSAVSTEPNNSSGPFKKFFKPKMRFVKTQHLLHNMTTISQFLEASESTLTTPGIHSTESTGTEKSRTYLCGRRTMLNPDFVEVQGINTYFGEYPWMLELFYYDRHKERNLFKCGASLIGPDIALTSAHCIIANTEYWVKAGDWYNRAILDEEFLPEQTRDVIDLRIIPNTLRYSGEQYCPAQTIP
ncbi:hypothetical protein WDU94_012776 [Cyamophila willieti]